MKTYVKPEIKVLDTLAEGVFAASGDVGCYSVNAYIHQTPQDGRGDYRIQANGSHNASDGHHAGEQYLTLHFNMPVTYISSNGYKCIGSGTSTLKIYYNYHNNGNDNVGLGDVVVNAEAGLVLLESSLDCNHYCGQH